MNDGITELFDENARMSAVVINEETGRYASFILPISDDLLTVMFNELNITDIQTDFSLTHISSNPIELTENFVEDHESISDLNTLALLMRQMSQAELDRFDSIVKAQKMIPDSRYAINIALNTDKYMILEGVGDTVELGRRLSKIRDDGSLARWCGFQELGTHFAKTCGGGFADDNFVFQHESWTRFYNNERDHRGQAAIIKTKARAEPDRSDR